jgi:UDP-N-acetylmuramoylalanine--D-glutamate ligase
LDLVEKMTDWTGRRVIIIGAARQGIALARYLVHHGAQVVLTDRRTPADLQTARQELADIPVEWALGGHPLSLLDGADALCPSGGVSLTLPIVVEARRRGLLLTNDSQIFLESAPCRVIGITGSAGKTTTTTLVGRICSHAVAQSGGDSGYSRVWVGGNIGNPLLSDVDEMRPNHLAVMELSSFQLDLMTCSPRVAAVLNVTPNHLDRHGTMAAYTAAKANILKFQSPRDTAVLGYDDPVARKLQRQVQGKTMLFDLDRIPDGASGAFVRNDEIILRDTGSEQGIMSRQEISLRGEHNLLNVLAACAIACAAGVPAEHMRAGIAGFSGLAHRLEFVRTWNGADWYNDSIATAPERAMAAIKSFNQPIVLLAGGRDKDLPWDDFSALVRERVDHLILFGEALEKIDQSINSLSAHGKNGDQRPYSIRRCQGLQEAIKAAAEVVSEGNVVLLSPGGTSFDEFRDFEERGEAFKRWVLELP